MLTCKEVTRIASEGLDRPLGPGERLALRLHLALCRGCANVVTQMRFLREAVARLGSR